MRVVVALGGNALLRRGEPPTEAAQRANVRVAADALARIAREHELVITHGNGPQVGLLALQAAALPDVAPYRLDVLDAETEGMIGYLLECELASRLPDRSLATLLTMVEVDPADPAFAKPTKPIGAVYPEPEARRVAAERSWSVAPDGAAWRRVVASPRPIRILEREAIRQLVAAGTTVIAAGGGGIPVARIDGRLTGMEAVVDKDATAALLARDVEAGCIVLATDVACVELEWGTARATPVRHATPEQLATVAFDAGSMGPKVDAACDFVRRTGGRAAIGALADIPALVAGTAGTQVRPSEADPLDP